MKNEELRVKNEGKGLIFFCHSEERGIRFIFLLKGLVVSGGRIQGLEFRIQDSFCHSEGSVLK